MNSIRSTSKSKPRVYIIEQPATAGLRYRYEGEGRSAGSIQGIHSDPNERTYPTIQISGLKSDPSCHLVVVVSLVTTNSPYLTHPHNLVGENCDEGVYSKSFPSDTDTIVFNNLGIQCAKKRDIKEILMRRKEKRIDPFANGFDHMHNPSKIQMDSVRLCFQVYIKQGYEVKLLGRVVSDPVHDKRSMPPLWIALSSHHHASVLGGLKMIILCDKFSSDKLQVRFYKEYQGRIEWEEFAEVLHIHKQFAITIKTPPYCDPKVSHDVSVLIQLYRPSDKKYSNSIPFILTPVEQPPPGHIDTYQHLEFLDENSSLPKKFCTTPLYQEPALSRRPSKQMEDRLFTNFDKTDSLKCHRKAYDQSISNITPPSRQLEQVQYSRIKITYVEAPVHPPPTTWYQTTEHHPNNEDIRTYYTNDATSEKEELYDINNNSKSSPLARVGTSGNLTSTKALPSSILDINDDVEMASSPPRGNTIEPIDLLNDAQYGDWYKLACEESELRMFDNNQFIR